MFKVENLLVASCFSFVVLCVLVDADADAEEKWSGCWTRFPADSTICRSEMGDEWEDIKSDSCGIADLGKKVLCKHSFPGCKATSCYSYLIPRAELCKREFDEDLPVVKGGFEDCFPGYYRSRCCPQ